jgi:hypothetical protein
MSDEKALLREKMSKRISGGVMLTAGLALAIILFVKSIDVKIADADTARSIINLLMITGGSLFGLDLAGQVLKK